jgi:hypothetical protein
MDGDPALLDKAVEHMFGPLGDPQSALLNGFTGGAGSAGEREEVVGIFELKLRFRVEISQT